MGGCINTRNNIIIIKKTEIKIKNNKFKTKPNKNTESLISLNLQIPQNHLFELSINTISPNELPNERYICDNESIYSDITNDTVKQIIDIIHF